MKIRAKTWCLLFGSICVLAIVFIIAVNYFFLDAYGYFSDLPYGQSGNSRAAAINAKIRYIRKNPDLYTGFIVGGSRTGVLDPALVSKYTGLSFYNLCFSEGDEGIYEDVINFLVENTQVKQIILQLNGQEISQSTISPKYYALDLSMLSLVSELKMNLLSDCTRNLLNFVLRRQVFVPTIQKNGMLDAIEKYSPEERVSLGFVEKNVLPYFQDNYRGIFTDKFEDNFPFLDFVPDSLERIKRKCLLHDVKLVIIVAPTAVEVLAHIESPVYYGFLQSVSRIGDFYNFSGFSKYNFNPYNFVDHAHYRREMGDKMLDIIFNKDPPTDDDWGLLLTPDNINEYLDRRKETYAALKAMYEKSGTMMLGAITDDSFIPLKAYTVP
jgi:hypothetical protein